MIRTANKFVARRLALLCIATVMLCSCHFDEQPSGIEGSGAKGIPTPTPTPPAAAPAPAPPGALTMTTARAGHTATLLQDGKVLIAGGTSDSGGFPSLASAELYNPATRAWKATGSLHAARIGQTSTVLLSGLVLEAAGANISNELASAELYNP